MITWQLTNNTVVFVNNIYNLSISFTGHVQGTVSLLKTHIFENVLLSSG
jgi:hypothetical protein